LDLQLNDIENSKKELTGELSYEELTPYFEKAMESYRKKANVPGFRKGKVPMNMIKKLYGEGLEYSAIEDITNEVFVKYIMDNKLDLLSRASIKEMDYKPKEKLTFKVEFEVMPEIKIDNYKGLELKKTKYIIDDSRVDDEIQYHRFRNATNEIDGVALDDNYIITVDLQNLDEAGNIIIGQSQKDLRIYLGNEQMFPEFKAGFKGIKEGEVRIIDSKNSEGGPKKVQITCTKVEKLVFPEMNEEFFKKITSREGIKTEEDFRSEIKNEIQKIYDSISNRKVDSDAISEMIKSNDIPAPERYIEVILNGMIDEYKQQFPKKQLPKDFNADEFKKEKRVDAILQAKWYLIREKMIEDNKIEALDDDYKKLAEENASRYNIPADKLIEAYRENEDIKMKILNDKVLDLIISNAKVTETEEIVKKEEQETE
jgi:trigger factor